MKVWHRQKRIQNLLLMTIVISLLFYTLAFKGAIALSKSKQLKGTYSNQSFHDNQDFMIFSDTTRLRIQRYQDEEALEKESQNLPTAKRLLGLFVSLEEPPYHLVEHLREEAKKIENNTPYSYVLTYMHQQDGKKG